MKRYLLLCLITFAFFSLMAFGIIKRQSYTNLTADENYLMQLQVAEVPEMLVEEICSDMERNLPNAPIILRVKAVGEIEHLFNSDRQKVKIQRVYAGDDLQEDEEVYLFSNHWQLVIDGTLNCIERGFVNIMEKNEEYLIFGEKVVENPKTDLLSVKLYDESIIAPVFSYKPHTNIIVPASGDTTYIPYQAVKDNEFFVESEVALEKVETLKRKILALFPAGDTRR